VISKLLGTLEPQAFDELIASFIERSESDAMSFAAFDQAIKRLAEEAVAETIEVTGMIKESPELQADSQSWRS
jgi:hypothetical protein